MGLEEKKLKLLSTLIVLADYKKVAQNKLRELLLKDTDNGKLYKYQSVTPYALECLENGTLYCAEASQFNDPFDSIIGYKFQDIFDAQYEEELNRLDDVLNKFMSVYEKSIDITEFSENEQRVISKLLSNGRLVKTINDIQSSIKTYEDVYKYYYDNPRFFLDLVEPVIEDGSLKAEFKLLKSVVGDKRFRNPKMIGDKQGKDGAFNELLTANGITNDTDEIGGVLLLSRLFMSEDRNKSLVELVQRVETGMRKLAESFRIGCLATSYKNRLMWAHYTNSHKGYCVEYDFSRKDKHTMSILPLPIIYSNLRPRFPWDLALKPTAKAKKEMNKQLIEGLLTKDELWKYENEWRILNSKNEKFVKMPPITCVYLGTNMNPDDEEKVKAIAKDKSIPVKKMRVDRGTYDLHAEEA